ncbi:MAG: hypothetical protein VX453_08055 [Acidobacteriota bacterium]|nr:hypothetical protein [Acidobacteriota bacterium]
MIRHPLIGLTLLLAILPAAAQVDRASVILTLDTDVINVGDPVTATVVVTHPPETEIVWPESPFVEPLELLDWNISESTAEGDVVNSRLELMLTAFELGELTLPTFEVQVVHTGGDVATLTTDAAVVTVTSVGRDDTGDIRDIRGPLAIPLDVMTLLPWLTGLVAMSLLSYLLYQRHRRKTRQPMTQSMASPRPAHVVAYESLDALETSGLLESGEFKAYHIRLSDIIRVYIWRRFGVAAMEMTTAEVLNGLRRADAPRTVVADFRQLLERCDLVKFAKFQPKASDCLDLIPLGRQLVDLTTAVNQVSTVTEAPPADPSPQPPSGSPETAEQANATKTEDERLNLDTRAT